MKKKAFDLIVNAAHNLDLHDTVIIKVLIFFNKSFSKIIFLFKFEGSKYVCKFQR